MFKCEEINWTSVLFWESILKKTAAVSSVAVASAVASIAYVKFTDASAEPITPELKAKLKANPRDIIHLKISFSGELSEETQSKIQDCFDYHGEFSSQFELVGSYCWNDISELVDNRFLKEIREQTI